jgi:hypothetical protein
LRSSLPKCVRFSVPTQAVAESRPREKTSRPFLSSNRSLPSSITSVPVRDPSPFTPPTYFTPSKRSARAAPAAARSIPHASAIAVPFLFMIPSAIG